MSAPSGPENSNESKRSRWPLILKIVKWLVIIGVVVGIVVAIVLTIWTIRATKDLPSVQTLSEYTPPVMSRVHAGDGKLISEFRTEARVFVPIESVPTKLQQAFVSSEDKRFYTHNGWDPIGLTRAALTAPSKKLSGQRIGGTSTITQQVAKNFLVGDDYSMKRKVREIFIARRMEKAFDKGTILELYLNDNYFGRGAYGVAAASLNHFGKEMDDLTVGEMAYLALVVKGPANYELDVPEEYAAAKSRQRYVLNRMAEDGYITQAEADEAYAEPLEWADRLSGAEYLAAEYFVEEARKQIFDMYGSEELYSGGLSIRTTLDTDMQLAGRRALRRGLEMLDRRMGWRGPLASFETMDSWDEQLAAFEAPKDIEDWRVAVVLERSDTTSKLGFVSESEEDEGELVTETGKLDLEDVAVTSNDDKGVLKVADLKAVLIRGSVPIYGGLNLKVRDITLPALAQSPFGSNVKNIEAHLELIGGAPPGNLTAPELTQWANRGGTVEVRSLRIIHGTLGLDGDGTMALDGRLQPVCAFSARVTGYDAALNQLIQAGLVRSSDGNIAKMILGALGKVPAGGGPKQIDVPISVQDQRLSIGPIPLMRVPAILW